MQQGFFMRYPPQLNTYLLGLLRQASQQASNFNTLVSKVQTSPTTDQKNNVATAYLIACKPWREATQLLNQILTDMGATVSASRNRQQNQPIFTVSEGEAGGPFRLNTNPTTISAQLDFLKAVCARVRKFSNVVNGFNLIEYFTAVETGVPAPSIEVVYGALCFTDDVQMTNPCNDTTDNNLNVCWSASFDAGANAYMSNLSLACALLTAQLFSLYTELQVLDAESIVVERIKATEAAETRALAGGLEDLPDRTTIKDELSFQFQDIASGSSDANSLGRVGLNSLVPSLGKNKNLGGYLVALLLFTDYFLDNTTGADIYVKTRKNFIQYATNLLAKYNDVMFEFISSVDKEELAKRVAAFDAQIKDSPLKMSLEQFATERLMKVENAVEDALKNYGSVGVGAKLALLNPMLGATVGAAAFTAQMYRQIDDITEQAKALCEKMEMLILLNMRQRENLSYTQEFSTFNPPIETLFAPVSTFLQAHDRAHETCFTTADAFWCKVYTYTASALILGLATYGVRRLMRSKMA